MIFEKVKDLVCDEMNCDPNKITMDTNFVDDLGADSLDAVELVLAIEDEFGIEISEEASQNIHTVGDIVKIIEANSKK